MSVELQHIFSQIQNELEKLKGDNDSYQYNEHNIDKERHNVLMCNETKDIQAYPGTGKTTILNDKIKLLTSYWNLRHSGILVLSHTNVAKNQTHRLAYPHYVDTIHGFINRFLGLPYLRSQMLVVKAVDDNLADSKGRKIMGYNHYLQQKNGIYSKSKRFCFINSNLSQTILFSELNINDTTDTARRISECRNKMTQQGYFYHDDLLCFSLKLIKENALLIKAIRKRFPIVLIDEAQDNSKLQSELLHKLFIEGENPSIIQRFGDINQAIYCHEEFDSWKFPYRNDNDNSKFCEKQVLAIKSSHRCKSKIAYFASKFVTSNSGFEGTNEGGNLYYIAFNKANRDNVIENFANKIRELNLHNTIPNFSAIAIGKDGRPEEVERECKKTKQIVQIPIQDRNLRINSYLATFSKDATKIEYKPKDFLDGLSFARMIVENEGNVNKAYKILMQCLQKEEQYYNKSKEDVIAKLKDCYILISKYFGLVKNSEKNTGEQICQALKIQYRHINNDAPQEQKLISNTYTGNEVNVRTDTIHGVKGETHHAVLVLETFTHFNTMMNILEYKLQSGKLKGNGKRAENKAILETYFVAFSRATDLLCLAIEDTQNNDISTHLEKYYNFQKL